MGSYAPHPPTVWRSLEIDVALRRTLGLTRLRVRPKSWGVRGKLFPALLNFSKFAELSAQYRNRLSIIPVINGRAQSQFLEIPAVYQLFII